MEAKVTEILPEKQDDQGVALGNTGQIIRVFVIRKGQSAPVLSACINMPPTEITTLV